MMTEIVHSIELDCLRSNTNAGHYTGRVHFNFDQLSTIRHVRWLIVYFK